jgi:hypothetical protein
MALRAGQCGDMFGSFGRTGDFWYESRRKWKTRLESDEVPDLNENGVAFYVCFSRVEPFWPDDGGFLTVGEAKRGGGEAAPVGRLVAQMRDAGSIGPRHERRGPVRPRLGRVGDRHAPLDLRALVGAVREDEDRALARRVGLLAVMDDVHPERLVALAPAQR